MSTETINIDPEAAIARNAAYAQRHKDSLVRAFCPAFYYHAGEDSFPTDPDIYIKDVIMAKHAEYTKPGAKLNDEEKKELKWIQDYFLTSDKKFKKDWAPVHGDPEWHKILNDRKFLTFDEKAYGYQLGDVVPIKGSPLTGQGKAPIHYAITPTPDGIMIKYQYFYAVSSAIPGTKWLHRLLPNWLTKKAKDFAIHAGDWEGAIIHVKIDENGKASVDAMTPFAHGRDGSRFVKKEDITYDDNGRPSVFVGQQTHGSYADNFVGRSRFVDLVGDKHKLVADKFVDLTIPEKLAREKFDSGLPQFTASEVKDLPRWTCFVRIGDTSHMLFAQEEYARDYAKYLKEGAKGDWDRYKPKLFLTKTWNKAKALFSLLTGGTKAKPTDISVDLAAKSREQDHSQVIRQLREKEREKSGSLAPTEVEKKRSRSQSTTSFMEKHEKRKIDTASHYSAGK